MRCALVVLLTSSIFILSYYSRYQRKLKTKHNNRKYNSSIKVVMLHVHNSNINTGSDVSR